MKATVTLGTQEVSYSDITAEIVAAAGLTEKLFEFGIGKLVAHKGNPRVWETAAQATLNRTGAEVRKAIATATVAEDASVEDRATAYAAALKISPETYGSLMLALREAARSVSLIALIRAERAPRAGAKVDPLLVQAREIAVDPARLAALHKFMKEQGQKAKPRTEREIHSSLFFLDGMNATPFEG
jgi:hypothetical protein